jgi:hypothetical protein
MALDGVRIDTIRGPAGFSTAFNHAAPYQSGPNAIQPIASAGSTLAASTSGAPEPARSTPWESPGTPLASVGTDSFHDHALAQPSFQSSAGLSAAALGAAGGVNAFAQSNDRTTQWLNGVSNWGTRRSVAEVLDGLLEKRGFHAWFHRNTKGLHGVAQKVHEASKGWDHILGIQNNQVAISEIIGSGGIRKYVQAVSQNLGGFRPGNIANNVREIGSVGGFVQNTLVGGNVSSIAQALSTGRRIFTAGASGVGLGLMGFSVLDKTAKVYHHEKSQEDGSLGSQLNTLGKTAVTFASQGAKHLVSWEASGIGFALGAALVPVAGLVAPLAGIALGSVFSVVADALLDPIIPDDPLAKSSPKTTRA